MKHKKQLIPLLLVFLSMIPLAVLTASEKPVQHLDLPDVTSVQEAKQVFAQTTAELKGKTKLDVSELKEIHIITYSLEKAIAYFSENLVGKQQNDAKKMAELVELVHLESENDRANTTRVYLDQYFTLANLFSSE